jgi:hypothetical protein
MFIIVEYNNILQLHLQCIHDWSTKKKNLFLKDSKGKLWIFFNFILL